MGCRASERSVSGTSRSSGPSAGQGTISIHLLPSFRGRSQAKGRMNLAFSEASSWRNRSRRSSSISPAPPAPLPTPPTRTLLLGSWRMRSISSMMSPTASLGRRRGEVGWPPLGCAGSPLPAAGPSSAGAKIVRLGVRGGRTQMRSAWPYQWCSRPRSMSRMSSKSPMRWRSGGTILMASAAADGPPSAQTPWTSQSSRGLQRMTAALFAAVAAMPRSSR
mmetsp:Transcript_42262/g.134232  ORF Transcript_42262/g.134232 Transcript_42262/m.134232 type:complete len:220 (+) Transcript_42262:745-1404(+)